MPQYHVIVLQKNVEVSKQMSLKFSNQKNGQSETFVCEIKKSGETCAIPFGAVNSHLEWIKVEKSLHRNNEKFIVQLKLESKLVAQFGHSHGPQKSTGNQPSDGVSGQNKPKESSVQEQHVDQSNPNYSAKGFVTVYPGIRYPFAKPKIAIYVDGKHVGLAFRHINQKSSSYSQMGELHYFFVFRKPAVLGRTKKIDLRLGGRGKTLVLFIDLKLYSTSYLNLYPKNRKRAVLDYKSIVVTLGKAKYYRKNEDYMYHYRARIFLQDPDLKDFIVRIQTHKPEGQSSTSSKQPWSTKIKNRFRFFSTKKNSDALGEMAEIFYFRTIFPPDQMPANPSTTTKTGSTSSTPQPKKDAQFKNAKAKPAPGETAKKDANAKATADHSGGESNELKKLSKPENEEAKANGESGKAAKVASGSGSAPWPSAAKKEAGQAESSKKGETVGKDTSEPAKSKKDDKSSDSKDNKNKDPLAKAGGINMDGPQRVIRFFSRIYILNVDEIVVFRSKDASFKQGPPEKIKGVELYDLEAKDPNRKLRLVLSSTEQQVMYHATFQISSAPHKQENLNVHIRDSGTLTVVPVQV